MIVFRICHFNYCNDLSGIGAEKYGGRWNSKGIPMLYTGETRALCTTEIAVRTPLGIIPEKHYLVSISVPDDISMSEIKISKLQAGWNSFPHNEATQLIGDRFISEHKFAVLKVPSAVVEGEFNYLINPAHPQARLIKVVSTQPFRFDERLFKK